MIKSFASVKIAPFEATHAVGLIVTSKHFDRVGMAELKEVKDKLNTMKRHFAFLKI